MVKSGVMGAQVDKIEDPELVKEVNKVGATILVRL
jgi:hypothetical protein